jgi:ABC-type lipoprotein release transport system permease subunit
MKIYLKLAWRNLWRNRRRTQLTMGAMIFACCILVFSLGYYDGILWNLINNATERENGHICLARQGYYANPSLADHIDAENRFKIASDFKTPIKGICPRINAFALLSCGEEQNNRTQPSQIIGVDFKAEKACSRIAQDMIDGTFLSGEAGEIIIGNSLAQRLKAKTGSEIVLFGSAADGSIASEILIVKGVFSSGDNLRDSALAFINLRQAQEIFVLEEKIHSLRLFLRDPMQAEEISSQLAKASQLEATAWQKMFPQVADLLKIWLSIQIFTTAMYYIALALITFNTMFMSFIERKREFAILKAIGMNKFGMGSLIMFESLMMSGISAIIGAFIGSAANVYFFHYPYDLSSWMSTISWGGSTMKPLLFCVPSATSLFMPITAMLVLGVFVALIPNYRLYRLKAVEALREG